MNYTKFNREQIAIIDCILNLIEHSGCNTSEIIEVLSELTGALIAYKATSKEEIKEFIENNLIQRISTVALDKFCIKQLKEDYGNI